MPATIDVDAVISQIDEEVAEHERAILQLRAERDLAVSLRNRAVTTAKRSAPAAGRRTRGANHGRTGLTAQVSEIVSVGGVFTVKNVQDELGKRGAHLDYEQVRNALGYLSRTKKTRTVTRGEWEWVSDVSNQAAQPAQDDSPAAMPHGLSVVSSSPLAQEAMAT